MLVSCLFVVHSKTPLVAYIKWQGMNWQGNGSGCGHILGTIPARLEELGKTVRNLSDDNQCPGWLLTKTSLEASCLADVGKDNQTIISDKCFVLVDTTEGNKGEYSSSKEVGRIPQA
jgi:hypothetical protein